MEGTEALPQVSPDSELLNTLKPYVRHCGDSQRLAWHIGSRKLLDYLVVYIAEGAGRFVVGGIESEAREGDLFWIPPDVTHEMEGFPPKMICPYVHFDLWYHPARSLWDFSIPSGMVDLSDLKELAHPSVSHPALSSLCGRLRSFTNQRAGQLIRDICAEAARSQPYATLRISGLLLGMIAEILRGQTQLTRHYDTHTSSLEKAADYMRVHCAENITIGEMAEFCRLSTSCFRRLFVRHYGCSPRGYLRRARIQLAKELMLDSDLNFSEIAFKIGFMTVHSFSRAFRSIEGISPTEYRKSGSVYVRVNGRRSLGRDSAIVHGGR